MMSVPHQQYLGSLPFGALGASSGQSPSQGNCDEGLSYLSFISHHQSDQSCHVQPPAAAILHKHSHTCTLPSSSHPFFFFFFVRTSSLRLSYSRAKLKSRCLSLPGRSSTYPLPPRYTNPWLHTLHSIPFHRHSRQPMCRTRHQISWIGPDVHGPD